VGTNKYPIYQLWAQDLERCPKEEFFNRLDQFVLLLEAENYSKIARMDKRYRHEREVLGMFDKKVIGAFMPLVEKVRKERLKLPDDLLKTAALEVREFENLLTGWTQFRGNFRCQTLFDMIRLTVEECVNNNLSSAFDDLISEKDGFKYLDYQKFSKSYGSYSEFIQKLELFEQLEAKEPWGHYSHIKYRDSSLDYYMTLGTGVVMKAEYLMRFENLIICLMIPDPKQRRTPSIQVGIPKLFSLSTDPTSIRYDGKNEHDRAWIPTRGNTQPFATLKLAAEKYGRNSRSKGESPSLVKLSSYEVDKHLANVKNCDFPPKNETINTEKRKLDLLLKNIRYVVPFTGKEVFVEKGKESAAFLVFKVPT
jgi:hypothetical protein